MKTIKGLSAAILACFMLFTLSACGGGQSSSDPNVGVYNGTTAEMWGMEMEIAEVWEGGFTIELKDGGKCKLDIDGKSASGKWTLKDGALTVSGGGVDCTGTLADGVMVLEDVLDSGITLTLAKEGADAGQADSEPASGTDPAEADETSAPAPTSSDPNVGLYQAATAEMWDMETDVTDLWENGFTIELKDDGKCTMNIDGDSVNIKWTLEDGVFTVKGGGLEWSGTLEDGVMVLEDVQDMGITLTLNKV